MYREYQNLANRSSRWSLCWVYQ